LQTLNYQTSCQVLSQKFNYFGEISFGLKEAEVNYHSDHDLQLQQLEIKSFGDVECRSFHHCNTTLGDAKKFVFYLFTEKMALLLQLNILKI